MAAVEGVCDSKETHMSHNKFTDNTIIAGTINRYKNSFGKSRVVVVKSQLGNPIYAFRGNEVYWTIPEDLPKFTKLGCSWRTLLRLKSESNRENKNSNHKMFYH